MILYWVDENYLTAIHNGDGSIKLFKTLDEADQYAFESKYADSLRVISIEGVKE